MDQIEAGKIEQRCSYLKDCGSKKVRGVYKEESPTLQ
jgi:hypothetical protein